MLARLRQRGNLEGHDTRHELDARSRLALAHRAGEEKRVVLSSLHVGERRLTGLR